MGWRECLPTEPVPEAAGSMSLGLTTAVYFLDGHMMVAEADALMQRLSELAHVFRDRAPVAGFMFESISALRVVCLKEDPSAAISHCDMAIQIADAIGHRRYQNIVSYVFVGMCYWMLGRLADAVRVLEASPVPDEEIGFGSSWRPFTLAWMLAERRELSGARQWANRLIMSGQTRRIPIDEGRGRWVLAEVLLRAGEFDAAETEIQSAITLLRAVYPLDVPGALATLAALRLAQGRSAEALAAAEEGLALYKSTGACSFFMRGAYLRLTHAESLRATGRHDEALAAISLAREKSIINADKIADPAYRSTFLEQVPENRKTLDLAAAWIGGSN